MPGDPLLNTWILWWNATAMPFTAQWWNGPVFWPLQGSLAFSEHLVGLSVLTTPLIWMGAGPSTAYSIAFLVVVAAQRAFRPRPGVPADGSPRRGLRRRADFRLQPVPRRADGAHSGACVVVDAARAPCAARRGSIPQPASAVAPLRSQFSRSAGCLQVLSNGYLLFYFSVLVALWLGWFATRRGASHHWPRSAVSLWTVAAADHRPGPPEIPRRPCALGTPPLVRRDRRLQRRRAVVLHGSRSSRDCGASGRSSGPEQELYPGIVVAAAGDRVGDARHSAGAGAGPTAATLLDRCSPSARRLALWRRSRSTIGPWSIQARVHSAITGGRFRKPLSLAIVSLTGAMLLSRAMAQAFRSRSVLALLRPGDGRVLADVPRTRRAIRRHLVPRTAALLWLIDLPGFNALRVPTRFAMVGTLTLAIAAAVGFARFVTPRARLARGGDSRRVDRRRLAAADPDVGLPQIVSPARRREGCGDRRASAGRHRRRRRRRDGPRHRASAPGRQRVQRSLRRHRTRSCGWRSRKATLQCIQALPTYGAGVRGHRSAVERDRPRASGRGRRRPTRRRRRPVRVLSVRTGAALTPRERRPIQARESRSSESARRFDNRLFDGRPDTVWTTRGPQRGRERFAIPLSAPARVSGVVMTLGGKIFDYPRMLVIETSLDGKTWEPAWRRSDGGARLQGGHGQPEECRA